MSRLNRDFFADRSDKVAQGLLGRYMYFQGSSGLVVARLREVAAYDGETRTSSEGMEYEPGLVSISRKFGHCMIDIASGSTDAPSCVTVRGVDVGTSRARGPGNVTKLFGIDGNNMGNYDGLSIAGTTFWIEGDPVSASEIRVKKGNSENCLGIYTF